MSGAVSVAIIVPVLDEAARLPALLDRLRKDFPDCPVTVVDGGSRDGSQQLVRPPARLVVSLPGRATQLNAGAAGCDADVLWFHHADTQVQPAALPQLRAAVADPAVVGGGFRLAFDTDTLGLRYVAASSNVRARRLGWVFGDQALFVRRAAFEALGGFPGLPIMEDLELSRRLARVGRLVLLPACSTASSRRFDAVGTWRLLARMQWLKAAYFAGVDPARLAAAYARPRPHAARPRAQGAGRP